MKAIRFERFGGPEVLQLVEVPVPEPTGAQVRVAVRVAGVNPADWKRREGAFGPLEFPAGTGFEIAGVVDAAGPEARWRVGDEVIGWALDNAGYAEYTLATQLAPKPATLSFPDAVAVPVAANTASGGLAALKVTAGDTVLVNGASGAVGAMAVQLARAAGAQVIGTASARNQEIVRELGASATTYGEGVVERVRALAPAGVDAIFDCAGHGFLDAAIELRGGVERIVTIADGAAAEKGVPFYSRAGGPALDIVERVARLVAEGEFRLPGPARTYPLAEAAAAQAQSRDGHGLGKIVLMVG
ncbi:NADP-dependent oxidoreductase [Nocardia pseudobrasiliensis]|uniref:NADPH:quinone reductase-like Zn-dependent oxidoreductase n=1 Tax=Nocardia pseudobrasiliensis TaxID=45979 RepID=A0A370I195_9NOCA|nr:NADP-dependent oxidoreductase [Nocardia pseudobrasiliensis]RDI63014.1 NADPH:quinone reductase-like Zn-dependent oxidoreductase [Nocardia pseudobrasiliensis]